MREDDVEGTRGCDWGRSILRAAMWGSLLPLLLLLHPYGGLVQDARIYIGRGMADRDPSGIGRDVMFAHDGQTSFSLMRELVNVSLIFMAPTTTAMMLTFIGAVAWLAALAALLRAVSNGRTAWAAVVCVLALPTSYGGYAVFDYAEAVATPRVFAQAAVLGGLAALMTGRRWLGLALLIFATAFHPLIALPGAIVGVALLLRHDRRWGAVILVGVSVVVGAAFMGVPLVVRLIQPMDAVWLSILRQRSVYLFPSQWPAWSFGPIVCQATAVLAASFLSSVAVRFLLLATLGVAAAGLAASWLFGDVQASILIVQIQPWRALWLLSLLGNAAFALVATALWARGRGLYLIVVPLALAWLLSDDLLLTCCLSALTLGLITGALLGVMPTPSPLIVCACAGVLGAFAILNIENAASMAVMLVRSAWVENIHVSWRMVANLQMQMVPIVAIALTLAVFPSRHLTPAVRLSMIAVVFGIAGLAAGLWDGRTTERTLAEWTPSIPVLSAAIGSRPGEVLWIDEDSESWFLLNRPSFLNSAQAGPILFSRDLALEWAKRVRLLLQLGMTRPTDSAPWGAEHPDGGEVNLTSDAVIRFCADDRHPAAIVAPGDQRSVAPPGAKVTLWRAPEPLHRIVVTPQDFRWRTVTLLTVIACFGD